MCGIAGILNLDGSPPAAELINELTDLLSHRGPDGRGIEILHNLALGHRRLSIIDLAGGAQPMYSQSRGHLISFNGEIFNYVELRDELRGRGVSFRTQSDTEVIMEAFAQWGLDSFSRLNGQFAFALYDIKARELYLVRDRMGEKPLYYALAGHNLIFGSELKVPHHFLRRCGLPLNLNAAAFFDFLSLNYVPSNRSMLAGVEALPAGTYLRLRSGQPELRSYWPGEALSGDCRVDVAPSEALPRLEHLLDSAIKFRRRSDVPVGLFLSGGLDSTSVACALKRQRSGDLRAFAADFGQSGFSEAQNARKVCSELGIPCEVLPVNPSAGDLPQLIESLVWHADQPLADSSALPVYLLSQATARKVKVVISGDGGDELFAGYLTYPATILARSLPAALRKIGPWLAKRLPAALVQDRKVGTLEMLERFLRNLDLPPGAAHFAWNGMFRHAEKLQLMHPDLLAGLSFEDTFLKLCAQEKVSAQRPSLRELMQADQGTYLGSDILSKVDRMSMAHGLEVRPVFMDHRLVEFSRSLPDACLRHGLQGKVLLRQYLRRAAPWYDLSQRKQGFSIPVHLWFRTVLKAYFSDLLHSDFARECGLYRHDYLLQLWSAHLAGRRNLGFELWGVMVSLLWAKKFLR